MSWSTAQIIREKTSQVLPNVDRDLHRSLAIAYLRLGEQENCLEMHGQKSCIFPIRGSGVHSATRGAQGAARELTTLLNADPRDEISRWLLNIAYMQLGQYPGKVPKQWLVPESNFASEYDIGEFPDVAPGVNLGITEHSGGIIVDDFDGDGLLDVMLSSSGPLDQLTSFTTTETAPLAIAPARPVSPANSRPQYRRDGLQQRRASRRAGAARGMVGQVWRLPDVAAQKQRRRHL